MSSLTRRTVIVTGGATVMGLSAITLAACSPASPGSTRSPSAATNQLQHGVELAKLGDIPVGDSILVKVEGSEVLLAQPRAGTPVAFSAICPHRGCVVAAAGATFHCPCHGSRFDAATGAVLNGPATRALTEIKVAVEGNSVVVG